MPFLECQQRLYPLRQGENRVGRAANISVRISELPFPDQLAIDVESVGCFAWIAGDVEGISINGRPLSGEPIPLFHGDRICFNGTTLQFIDDGSKLPSLDAPPATAEPSERGEATANTDLLSLQTPPLQQRKVVAVLRHLSSNQAYIIRDSDFRIGREKRCHLIIPDPSVSRLQAEISVAPGQYMLRHLGRSSTRVNGRKLSEPHLLKPGDIIKIASHEFVFSRRPAAAEEIARSDEVTPIRGAVPEAPTVQQARSSGTPLVTWMLVVATAALAAFLLL